MLKRILFSLDSVIPGRLAFAAAMCVPILAGAAIGPAKAHVQDSDDGPAPVVVELFTSQSCGKCPAANLLMAELGEQDGVLALSFSVDYWNVMGWEDTFATPEFTNRQQDYTRTLSNSMVYTPQFVFQGVEDQRGSGRHHHRVRDQLRECKSSAPLLSAQPPITLVAQGDQALITIGDFAAEGPATVWWFEFIPGRVPVDVGGGLNADKTVTLFNPVTTMHRLGDWEGGAQNYSAPMTRDRAGAIVIQDNESLEIRAAQSTVF